MSDSVPHRRLSPRDGVWLLIVTTLAARLLFAAALGLGIDESYMVAAGRSIHVGYLDHPPIAWWLAWAAAQIAGTDAAWAVRLPFVLLFSLSTWLMYRLASVLFSEAGGLWAAVAMNAAPVLGVTAGTWVLPDGPLIAALLCGTLCFVQAVRGARDGWRWWVGTGVCFGLALCSKYTAVLSGAGLLLFLLTEPGARQWLRRPQPYVAAMLALALFVPVLAWNAAHGWASLLFQGGRADGGRWHVFGPVTALAGEALFYVPWIWLALMACLWRAAKAGPKQKRGWLLFCLAVPPIVVFELVSLRARVLFHWAAPGTMLALPLLGEAIREHRRFSRIVRGLMVATAVLVPLGVFVIGTEVRFNWMPDLAEHFAIGADPDLAAVDWTSLRTALAARGYLHAGVVVGATRWGDAGKIDYALHGVVPVICLGNDPREYGITAPAAAHAGADILIVAPRMTLAELRWGFARYFESITALPPVMLQHAGRPALQLQLYMGHRLQI